MRVDIEEREHGRGCAGSESCQLDLQALNPGQERLTQVLAQHQLTQVEWLLLDYAGHHFCGQWTDHFLFHFAQNCRLCLHRKVTVDECRAAFEHCVTAGWVRIVDEAALAEIESLMHDEPSAAVLPQTSRLNVGNVDFTPAGARFYRQLSAEWLGMDWEDQLLIDRGLEWKMHYYCASQQGFEGTLQEHEDRGDIIVSSNVVPVGPWCVHWWQRFPAGYRMGVALRSGASAVG